MKYIPKYLFTLLMCIAILSSCADKQDFDQLDNHDITPTAEASILYVETPERIINEVNGINFFSQIFNFDAFNEQFFADNVLDGVVTYEVENTTSKPLDIMNCTKPFALSIGKLALLAICEIPASL